MFDINSEIHSWPHKWHTSWNKPTKKSIKREIQILCLVVSKSVDHKHRVQMKVVYAYLYPSDPPISLRFKFNEPLTFFFIS